MSLKTVYTYKCPNCATDVKRDYKPCTVVVCDYCKSDFPADDNWVSTCTDVGKSSRALIPTTPARKSYQGGCVFEDKWNFKKKIEVIVNRFKPQVVEHGHGYSVMEYEYTHEAARVARHLKTYTCHYEGWKVESNSQFLVVMDTNWEPGNEKEENSNENYAG